MDEGIRSALSRREVPMVEPEVIVRIRGLGAVGWGARRISREVGVARNTVRRYLRGSERAEVQVRPGARRLGDGQRRAAEELFVGLRSRARSSAFSNILASHSRVAQLSESGPES